MTLHSFLESAQWREVAPDPAKISGRLDVDRIAAELYDLGHTDLAGSLSSDDHPIDAAIWAWRHLRARA